MDNELKELLQNMNSSLKRIILLLEEIKRKQSKNNVNELDKKMQQYITF